MKYQDTHYISVKFLKDNDLILNESIFFKTVPQRYKLKVVDSKLFNQLKSIKEGIERISEVDMEIPNWVVSDKDVDFQSSINSGELFNGTSEYDYLDFITMDFYKSMKWVGYSKRTKLGGT